MIFIIIIEIMWNLYPIKILICLIMVAMLACIIYCNNLKLTDLYRLKWLIHYIKSNMKIRKSCAEWHDDDYAFT